MKHDDITKQIIKAFYTVYGVLGYGFLEKVYENALAIELRKLGLKVAQQAQIVVYYDGREVGRLSSRFVGRRRCDCRTESQPGLGAGARGSVAQLSQSHALRGGAAAQLWPRAADQTQNLR